jgi:hypothetical protein
MFGVLHIPTLNPDTSSSNSMVLRARRPTGIPSVEIDHGLAPYDLSVMLNMGRDMQNIPRTQDNNLVPYVKRNGARQDAGDLLILVFVWFDFMPWVEPSHGDGHVFSVDNNK